MEKFFLILLALVSIFASLGSQEVYSAFPGENGKIAFTSTRDVNQEVYVMNADGTSQINLSNSDRADYAPNWQLIPQNFVGGEFIPIETTSLIVAGAQSFSWMIPVVLSGIGIGLFAVSRKSE